jgi:hypothetical protein
MKTRRAGSNMPCSRIQGRRARTTSARTARLLVGFFKCNLVTLKETLGRGAATEECDACASPKPLHPESCQAVVRLNPTESCTCFSSGDMLPPRGLGMQRPVSRKALDPPNRRAGIDLQVLRVLGPRSSAFNFRNYSLTHVPGIGPRHRSPQKRINAG